MDRKFNYSSESESDEVSEVTKNLMEEMFRRHRAGKLNAQDFRQLSSRQQHLIEVYVNSKRGQRVNNRDKILVKEFQNGRISFAHDDMESFPFGLVEVLRNDITHLDLTSNRIRDFDFLRGFHKLKSLIIDNSVRMDFETLPPMEKLELFYANKCRIEFPRSFINRISIVFPSIKFCSMMYNPIMKRKNLKHIWIGREHRLRMFAIFMMPNLKHFNDMEITNDERDHSRSYHMYLGPIDCTPSKFKTLPDTDDIRRILPVRLRDETEEFSAMLAQEEAERLDRALSAVSISGYFSRDSADYKASAKSDKASEAASKPSTSLQVSPAPSEHFSE